MKRFMWALLLMMFVLVGCNSKLDTTTPQSFKESRKKVAASFDTKKEQADFDNAIDTLIVRGSGPMMQRSQYIEHLEVYLHGKTGPEIMESFNAGTIDSEIIRTPLGNTSK